MTRALNMLRAVRASRPRSTIPSFPVPTAPCRVVGASAEFGTTAESEAPTPSRRLLPILISDNVVDGSDVPAKRAATRNPRTPAPSLRVVRHVAPLSKVGVVAKFGREGESATSTLAPPPRSSSETVGAAAKLEQAARPAAPTVCRLLHPFAADAMGSASPDPSPRCPFTVVLGSLNSSGDSPPPPTLLLQPGWDEAHDGAGEAVNPMPIRLCSG